MLEQKLLLGTPVPKISHGYLVGSGFCITRVSRPFNFSSYLLLLFFGLFNPMAGLTSLVILLVKVLSLYFLWLGNISAIFKELVLYCALSKIQKLDN